MVFYYKSRCGEFLIYMGKVGTGDEGGAEVCHEDSSNFWLTYVVIDNPTTQQDKYENEDLIKYGLPEDVWFHVDDLSSAHVYLRMKPGMTLDSISNDLLLDCAALVKANSIQGCKKSSVYVVYTRWKNLKKTNQMVDGQVGFHRPENVRRIEVEKNGPIVRGRYSIIENGMDDLCALAWFCEPKEQSDKYFLCLFIHATQPFSPHNSNWKIQTRRSSRLGTIAARSFARNTNGKEGRV